MVTPFPPSFSKEIVDFLKSNATKGLSKASNILKDKLRADRYDSWIGNMSKGWVARQSQKGLPVTNDEIKLFFKIITSMHALYSTNNDFISIGLIPDKDGFFGQLHMQEYFIQLSYVTRKEINTRDSILRSETEINKNKIRKAIHANKQLNKDYIAKYNFDNVDSLLILGSPGVGKTTFCKWLCNWWSIEPEHLNLSPVYIELKKIKFDGSSNSLIGYILHNYIEDPGVTEKEVRHLFNKMHTNFVLVLDGYDELTEENKKKLNQDINEVTGSLRYIVSSRPYGILDTYGLSFKKVIQLNGFDDANINLYIEKFLSEQPNALAAQKKLKEIIFQNPVLDDFASNPLMLSFIVFIYLTNPRADSSLRKITSRYKLQEEVVNWAQIHHEKKGNKKISKEDFNLIAACACNMELDKKLELTFSETQQSLRPTLTYILEIGLGNFSGVHDNSDKARFYFTSVTFQEFFAAQYLYKFITPAALDYLNNDSFFWNLTAMLVGKLNNEANFKKSIDNLLSVYRKDSKHPLKNYAFYKYILVFSECNHSYINEKLNAQTLNLIYDGYYAYSKDERLDFGVAECIIRLYKKMTERNKVFFQEIILQGLVKFWKKNKADLLTAWNNDSGIFESLFNYLELNDDPEFLERSLTILIPMLEEIRSDKVSDVGYVTVPAFLVEMLPNLPFYDTKLPLKFRRLLELLPADRQYSKNALLSRYASVDDAKNKLNKAIKDYSELLKPDKVALSQIISESIYILGHHYTLKDFNDEKEIGDLIINGASLLQEDHWLEDEKYQSVSRAYFQEELKKLVIGGMLKLNGGDHVAVRNKALQLVTESTDLSWEFIRSESFVKYFQEYSAFSGKNGKIEKIKTLCLFFTQIKEFRNYLALYRQEIVEFILEYINKNSSIVEQLRIDSGNTGLSQRNDRVLETLIPFHNLLYSSEIYETDKRFMVDALLKNRIDEYDLYKLDVFPNVLISNYVFNDLTWEYLFTCFGGSREDIEAGFDCLRNDSIYQYGTNLGHLMKVMELVVSWKKNLWFKEFIDKFSQDILMLIADVFLMSKHLKQDNTEHVIKLAKRLFSFPAFRIKVNGESPHYSGNALTANVFFYYYAGSKKELLSIDYYSIFRGNHEERDYFFQLIYDFFSEGAKIKVEDSALIEEMLGTKLNKRFSEFCRHQEFFHFPFKKTKFSSMLKQSK